MTALLFAIFFLSGAAALLFETLWFQQAGLALGNSVWASSVVMAAFMGGLALGNGLAARLGTRVASPVRWYALLELVIGATGVALVYGLPFATPFVARMLQPWIDQVWLQQLVRLALAFGLLVIPSTAMGATLPLLVKELYSRDPHFGRNLGGLYGWNTLGAVMGCVAGHALVQSWLGIRGSAWVAAATNLLAALAALAIWRAARDRPLEATARDARISGQARRLLGAAALCGAVLLALEVVWFRFLLLFIHGTSLAFALMLAVVLGGIGLGGLAGARWLSRHPDADRSLPFVACVSGGAVVLTYVGFGRLAGSLMGQNVWQGSVTLGLSLGLMLPAALLSGVMFTLLGQALQRETSGEIRPAGLLTMANTLGAMVGSLVGGFLLLPAFGVEHSIQILALGYALAALLMASAGLRSAWAPVIGAGVALAVLALWLPLGSMQAYQHRAVARFEKRGATPVAVREGLTETSILLEYRRFGVPGDYRLLTNSYSMSTTNFRARRYMKLFVYLPVALHPDPRSALLISFGVGATAQSLTDTAALERIDVVDISRDILNLSSVIYRDPARDPLRDPRVTIHVEDGRHYLETRERRYDVITGEPPPPKVAGIVNLFTKEYFRAIRARLNDGGVASYWLPSHGLEVEESKAIIRAFCDVFDDCSLWDGSLLDWILVGTRGLETRVSREHFSRQWHDPGVAPELEALGIERPEQLGALFMADSEFLRELTRETAPLDDDHPGRVGFPVIGPRVALPLYRSWLDAEASRVRFANSDFIARLWPPELVSPSLEFFQWQRLINEYFSGKLADPASQLRALDRLQTSTSLKTLPLWLLASSHDLQAQALRARAQGQGSVAIRRERVKRAMAEGDYGFASDEDMDGVLESLGPYLRVYALCREQRMLRAERELEQIPAAARNPRAEKFLNERFGLGVEREAGAGQHR